MYNVVYTIIKWSWGQRAVEIDFKLDGDMYKFIVKNLQNITFQDLKKLNALNDWVKAITIRFTKSESLLLFSVTRTLNYISAKETQIKPLYFCFL